MAEKKYGLGYLPDPEDIRDIPMSLVLPVVSIPKSIDYTKEMSPVEDQDGEGVCVAFACGDGMKEYQEKKERREHINLSTRYLYQKCKEIDGIPDLEGTYIRVAMKVLRKKGIPPEECWPFIPHNIGKPSADADEKAYSYRIKAFARLKNVMEMKRSLVINGPFVAGVQVYDSFLSEDASRTGIIPLPGPDETLQGGHAICIVGYNDEKQLFKFKNSWSEGWGDNGYGYIGYEYLQKYCSDAWSATDLIENPEKIIEDKERKEDKEKNKDKIRERLSNATDFLFQFCAYWTICHLFLGVIEFISSGRFRLHPEMTTAYLTLLSAYAANKEAGRWSGVPRISLPPEGRKGEVFVYIWWAFLLVEFIISFFNPLFSLSQELVKICYGVLAVFFGTEVSKAIYTRQ